MSYGIWSKRGKGWNSMEIDTPGNRGETIYDYRDDSPKGHALLTSGLDAEGISWSGWDDWHAKGFELRAVRNGRTVTEYAFGGGEHVTWIGYDDEAALRLALTRLTESREERLAVLRREGFLTVEEAAEAGYGREAAA